MAVLHAPGVSHAQKQSLPRIEESVCSFNADRAYKTRCGYLVVSENRKRPGAHVIKLPFIQVESNNPRKSPDPLLYTGGGPGLSALHAVTSIHRRALLQNRDYIAFDQRGTHFALPNLECEGLGRAVQRAYIEHRSTDGAAIEAVRECHKKLASQGIDLSAYNTDDSAADIEDLRRLLKIDALNLMGISYSGGLMMAVLHRYPEHIRSLILDSPLPEFVNIDEQELANFNEALTEVLNGKDLSLAPRFRTYLNGLDGKTLTISYQAQNGSKVQLNYGRPEILSILHGKLEDYEGVQTLAQVVGDLIAGNQDRYIQEYFDGVFAGKGSISGMRLSVYCSDKMAYADPSLIHQQETTMPWLAGFHVNDVYKATCNAWPVKPIEAVTKNPFYSNVPVLLGAGQLDDACRPIYNDMIHHYFPNSQRLLFTKRLHGPLLNSVEGDVYIAEFLQEPGRLLKGQKEIEVY
jgi:pimeloyl-ACP methyl ester carboxylesterase